MVNAGGKVANAGGKAADTAHACNLQHSAKQSKTYSQQKLITLAFCALFLLGLFALLLSNHDRFGRMGLNCPSLSGCQPHKALLEDLEEKT